MVKNRDLNTGDRLPTQFLDQVQEVTGTYVSPNFQLDLLNTTTLRLLAGVGNDQVGVMINGRWRYNQLTVTTAHPGGSAGAYDVYVTATDNVFLNPGQVVEVDSTNYAFGLSIKPVGTTPTTTLWRKVGGVYWNGTAITRYWVFGVQNDTVRTPATYSSLPDTAVPVWDATNKTWVVKRNLPRLITDVVSPGYTPSDGDLVEFSYQAYTDHSILWKLRYKADNPSRKWQAEGAPPVYRNGTGSGSSLSAVTVSALTMPIPAPGEYLVRLSAVCHLTNPPPPYTYANLQWIAKDTGGSIITSAPTSTADLSNFAPLFGGMGVFVESPLVVGTAGTIEVATQVGNAGISVTFSPIQLTLIPIALGT
jgi:hypothetical protein